MLIEDNIQQHSRDLRLRVLHLLSFVLCEVEDDNVRPVSPLREGEQLSVLVDGQRGQMLPPGKQLSGH